MSEQKWERLQPTFSFEDERLDALKKIVPEAFADGKIDFDSLRELLGETVENSDEHFGLNWTGKSEARRLAGMPSKGTLVPVLGKGLHEDTTQNIFIEGDNLEVLKLLHKAYRGRIKMIYIDPPYNTGNDFVYKDDYRMPLESYLERSGQKSDAGELLTSNPKSSGRFHSDWLNMMYPRIRIAKDLLRDDGILFVSIDDNEAHNLRHVLAEVFGEESSLGTFVWQSRTSISNDQDVSMNHNYIYVYSRDIEAAAFKGEVLNESEYSNPDSDPRGPWKPVPIDANKPGGDTRYGIINPKTGAEYFPPSNRSWALNSTDYKKLFDDNRISFGTRGEAAPKRKMFLRERLEKGDTKTPSSLLLDAGTTQDGTNEIMDLFDGKKVFSYPKPTKLLSRLLQFGNVEDSIVLDFFAGSGTTAHAVMQANKAGAKCSFICVQIGESIPQETDGYKAGFRTIPDLTAERLRRASKAIGQEDEIDLGFKYFKLESSNFTAWQEYRGNDLDQLRGLLKSQVDSTFASDAEDVAVLMEVLLLEGFPLNANITVDVEFQKNIVKRIVSPFSEHRLFMSLDDEIQEETIRQAEELEKLDIFVCLDSALTDRDKVRLADVCRLKTL